MTQGEFALLVIHEVNAEVYMENTITGKEASLLLSKLGLAPRAGWKVNEELTLQSLKEAFARLAATYAKSPDADSEDATLEAGDRHSKGDCGDLSRNPENMTVSELIDSIVCVASKALLRFTTERAAVSPTGGPAPASFGF